MKEKFAFNLKPVILSELVPPYTEAPKEGEEGYVPPPVLKVKGRCRLKQMSLMQHLTPG